MKALVKVKEEEGFVYQDMPDPRPGLRDVVIRVRASAICGSDLKFYHWDSKSCRRLISGFPFIPGHECSGEVVEIGAAVTHVKVGDRVAFDSHIPCGHCRQCQLGYPETCLNMGLFGHNIDGCFAEYAMVKETGVRVLPEGMTWEQGAMLEPLGVVVRPVFDAEVGMSNICVIGCGPIGQFAIALASALGAIKIYAVDVNPLRLEYAVKNGASHIINSAENPDFSEVILKETGGLDAVIDASGNQQAINEGLYSLRRCGKMFFIGNPKGELVIQEPVQQIIQSEVTMKGNFGRSLFWTWDKAEKFLMSGKIDLDHIITHRFALKDFDEAFRVALSGEGCKVLLLP